MNSASNASSNAIVLRNVSHDYGGQAALSNVSFAVARGEIFGFIGPNGAGKTTTIRCIATLLEPTSGTVEVMGHDVTLEPEAVRRRLGYMPDHAGVYERITVREYLEFFADAYGVGAVTSYEPVERVMRLTDLAKLQDRLVASMSKGMKQRLQLARVLLHDPEVLVLDEPASDLDPRARIEIRDLLVELRNMGKTIFLSSHILSELADLCTSVAILEGGRVVVDGPIGEIGARLELGAALPRAEGHAYRTEGRDQDPHPAPSAQRARIRTLVPAADVMRALAGAPHLRHVEPWQQQSVVVSYGGDDAGLAAIVRALVTAGVPIVGVEPERNELERIFLKATRGQVQ
ncbi:MAG: ABC transporter ATP-binding protein [Labilithrix sp.]